jgi:hypothetical protein
MKDLAADLRRQSQTLFLPRGHDSFSSVRSTEENVCDSLRLSVCG